MLSTQIWLKELRFPIVSYILNTIHYYMIISMYDGMEVQLHVFLPSALNGGEWSASCPGHLRKSPQYPPDRRMDRLVWMWWQREKNIPHPCLELNPGCPAHSLLTILTELSWILF
jgi:hypothetical protein